MAKVKLIDVAIARSGDKGNDSNVGVMARSPELYHFLVEYLTTDVVKEHFKEICKGGVDRYLLPNLNSLNFILHESLGGGGSEAMITDAQGKIHGSGILQMTLDVPDELLP